MARKTSGVVTMNIGAIYRGKPTTVGQPLPTVEAKVVEDGGAELPSGQPGELLVRSPIVIHGYLNKPEATSGSKKPPSPAAPPANI